MTLDAWGWIAWSVGWIVTMCVAYLPRGIPGLREEKRVEGEPEPGEDRPETHTP